VRIEVHALLWGRWNASRISPGEFMQVLQRIVSRPVVLAIALAGFLTMAGCGGNSPSTSTNVTATPTFTPGAGSYNTSQTVTIADTTPGAVLYCTTDGTTPTTSSPQCSQPTTVFKTEFLQAIAVAPGIPASAAASAGYTINLNAAATPTFSPAGGSYTSAQTVAINDATAGVNIYYTTDGSVPTASSTLYAGPITLAKSTTLSAIAIASGFANSGVASASYVIGTGTAPPVISPAGGTFNAATPVTMTDATSGASIYYTSDGSIPTAASMPYSGPITVSTTETINAIAIASGNSSSVVTAAFTVNITSAAPPTFSPAGGIYTSSQTVILSDATAGASIYYTIDGSTPTTSSTLYGNPITVSTSETIKAIAIASGFGASAVSSAAYTINGPVATPTFNPAAGSYTSAQTVTISDATSGAAIYYTTDGSTPTTSSTAYNAPISVSATETLQAIAAVGGSISSVATAAYTINVGPTFSGMVLSGTLPVNGAQVQMYAAGQAGYGSSATALLTTAVTTDATGAFSFTYNCPASPGDLVYLVATGGHTGTNGPNSGLALMAALGSCNATLPATVVVNEATTVASAYALSPFMTGATHVGAASSTASYQGLTNAFKTVSNMVDLTTGTVLSHTPDYSMNLASDTNVLNNSTVPQSRINTLANVLNACAAAGTGCTGLFSAATPTSGTAPADTLQAILNIAQNPGTNVSVVFNVAPTGPFTPVLSAAPNDWTLALTFTGGGLGFAPDLQITSVSSPFTDGKFLNTAMAIDATGNIWVTGFTSSISNAAAGNVTDDLSSGMIAEFSNLGKPLTPTSSVGVGGAVTYGGYISIPTSGANGGTQAPLNIAFDPSGNVWVVGGSPNAGGGTTATMPGGAMTEIKPGLSVAIPYISLGSSTNEPIAIDGLGNVWTYGSSLLEFDGTGKQLASNTGAGVSGNPVGYLALESLLFDSNSTSLWGSDAELGEFYQISPKDGSGIVDYSWVAGRNGVYTNVAADNAGNVYGCRLKPGGELDVLNASSTSTIASYPISTGRGCGNQMAMDGAGHLFTVTGSTGSTITPGIIDEFTVSSSGITLVSSTGYTGTGNGETPTINGDPSAPSVVSSSAVFRANNGGVASVAIDGSGNLWVLNVDTGTDASLGNALVEYVGIAAPVVTPTSQALANGQVGVRP
jgi:hypothetical protein